MFYHYEFDYVLEKMQPQLKIIIIVKNHKEDILIKINLFDIIKLNWDYQNKI